MLHSDSAGACPPAVHRRISCAGVVLFCKSSFSVGVLFVCIPLKTLTLCPGVARAACYMCPS